MCLWGGQQGMKCTRIKVFIKLACCSPWGHKELDTDLMTEQQQWKFSNIQRQSLWRFFENLFRVVNVHLTSYFKKSNELLIAKFRLKLNKVGKMTVPFRNDLNQIPYNFTVEERNRFKGLDLIECLMNYGWRFMKLYRRQGWRLSPRRPFWPVFLCSSTHSGT